MYISKLEIFGFKSFANKTVLTFQKGINGVVGPNGCGKTNIVDAIRWVLGEQKSSTLRSDKMENVIFNGTKKRKPLGMSEVSMTLVNDDGTLPTDYSEVTITRRIFRSGESEYLLNKNVCRLKDITNLFMDTGMATNAYSVIELKMVEGILNDKTGERRKMFEEAAGVNKYKHRRKLALKRLQEVKGDLTRVNDIVSEVEKTVRSLERQAKKADKYNALQAELREKELIYSERRFSLLEFEIRKFKEKLEELKNERNLTDSSIREIEPELIALRNTIGEVERRLRIKQQEIGRTQEKKHEANRNISVAQERKISLERNIERYEEEIEELQLQRAESLEEIEEAKKAIAELSDAINLLQMEINEQTEIIEEKRNGLSELRADFTEKENELHNAEIKLNDKRNEIASLEKTVAQRNERVDLLNAKISSLTDNIAKTIGFIEQLENEKISAEETLAETERELSEKKAEKEKLEKQAAELREKEMSEKSALEALKDKIEFIQSLIDNLEGVSKGAKILIENSEWTDKEKTLFADVGNAKDEFRFALEAALKNVLNNLLVEDLATLNSAVEYLKNNNLGKASFYLLKNLGSAQKTFFGKLDDYFREKKNKKIANENGYAGRAIDFIETEEKWRPYFEKILRNYAVAESLSAAIELVKKYPDFIFVTPEGDLVQADGIIEAGSLPKLDDSIFGRRKLVENLRAEYETRAAALEDLRFEIAKTEEAASSIDLDSVSERGKRMVNEINNIEKQISRMEAEREKFEEQIEDARAEIQKETDAVNLLQEQAEALAQELERMEKEKEELSLRIEEARDFLTEKQKEFDELMKAQNERLVRSERLSGTLRNERNNLESAENQVKKIDATLERLKNLIEKSREEIAAVEILIDDSSRELEEANDELNVLREERIKIENELREIKEKSSEFENTLQSLRHKRTSVSDKIHEIEMSLSKLEFERNGLVEHIKEEYSVQLEYKEFEDNEDYDFQSVHEEVMRLKNQIKNLGPINLLAFSEYEEEKERLDFLLTQRNDLLESEKDLIKTIEEINEKAQTQFMEIFEQIRENFKINFRTLFDPGDEADLVMEENDDPLEAKIEIIAKPKGKRPTTIDLLSQGEKTLTATALLFAFYLVKPSPFCILDEVDAPLDDANIDRFTRLLKKFVERTQFIIVTHNKRTMEAADAMYGVTMVEDGVSKLAAIKFDELQLAE